MIKHKSSVVYATVFIPSRDMENHDDNEGFDNANAKDTQDIGCYHK